MKGITIETHPVWHITLTKKDDDAFRVLHHYVNEVKYMNPFMLNQHIFRRHSNRKLY